MTPTRGWKLTIYDTGVNRKQGLRVVHADPACARLLRSPKPIRERLIAEHLLGTHYRLCSHCGVNVTVPTRFPRKAREGQQA